MLAWDELAQLDGLGGSIRARRIELGWTQSELAERSGVPQADISRIENDRLDARWSTVQRLLTALAEGAEPRRSLANGRRVTATPTPSNEVDAEQAGDAHPTLLDVILRDVAPGDDAALASFDPGSGTSWLDEVTEIVGGLIAWQRRPG
ncbi:MAG: helix-turn-helix domain-containing protein [Microthrixaceae bacterium]